MGVGTGFRKSAAHDGCAAGNCQPYSTAKPIISATIKNVKNTTNRIQIVSGCE